MLRNLLPLTLLIAAAGCVPASPQPAVQSHPPQPSLTVAITSLVSEMQEDRKTTISRVSELERRFGVLEDSVSRVETTLASVVTSVEEFTARAESIAPQPEPTPAPVEEASEQPIVDTEIPPIEGGTFPDRLDQDLNAPIPSDEGAIADTEPKDIDYSVVDYDVLVVTCSGCAPCAEYEKALLGERVDLANKQAKYFKVNTTRVSGPIWVKVVRDDTYAARYPVIRVRSSRGWRSPYGSDWKSKATASVDELATYGRFAGTQYPDYPMPADLGESRPPISASEKE